MKGYRFSISCMGKDKPIQQPTDKALALREHISRLRTSYETLDSIIDGMVERRNNHRPFDEVYNYWIQDCIDSGVARLKKIEEQINTAMKEYNDHAG